jgi:hypothetical protein
MNWKNESKKHESEKVNFVLYDFSVFATKKAIKSKDHLPQ